MRLLAYLAGIYGQGLTLAAALALGAWGARQSGWTPDTWLKLGLTGAVLCSVYYGSAYFWLLDGSHRAQIAAWLRGRMPRGAMRDWEV